MLHSLHEDYSGPGEHEQYILVPERQPEPTIFTPPKHDMTPSHVTVVANQQHALSSSTRSQLSANPAGAPGDKVIVMGKLEREDTSWVAEYLPDWQHAIYTVDNSDTPLHTTINKGREANPYLTYLINHYHNLPSTVAFLHSHRDGWPEAWHTDTLNYDNVNSINSLNIHSIQRKGYANLRCNHTPGCPDEVQPFRQPRDETRLLEVNMPAAWKSLFNNTDVPQTIATPCCAQFAVSKIQVLKRPLIDYIRYHDWLMNTPLPDDVSGRIFEYLWHIIFGQDPVYCPPLDQCYHDLYGR